MNRNLDKRTVRAIRTDFATREADDGLLIIEGYFAVFNSIYEIAPGMTESIAPGAFSNTLANDIRALINHDTTLVIGRNKAHTLDLKEDERGLWGSIIINPKDSDAVNGYERVNRGDVDQCSFGFQIRSEDTDIREDGSVHWTITDVDLYEVSICTFPAYDATQVTARSHDRDEILSRTVAAWQARMKGVTEKWH